MKHSYEYLKLPIVMYNESIKDIVVLTKLDGEHGRGFGLNDNNIGETLGFLLSEYTLYNGDLTDKQVKLIKDNTQMYKYYIDVDLECVSSENLERSFNNIGVDFKYHGETFAFSRSGKYSFKSKKKDYDDVIKSLTALQYYKITFLKKSKIKD
jgi:hypothetical protein